MMISRSTMFPNVMLALLIWLLHMGARNHNLIRAIPIGFQCLESERDALLKFKESFTMNPSGHFSSWILDGDCCQWRGVGCDNSTGHVIALNISNQDQSLISEGEFVASLSGLPFLSYLDLSGNNFHQVKVPNLVGSFASLEHLNLSKANFKGPIPNELGNLSRLRSVDLSGNSYSLVANNLHWLHGLSSLEVLDLGGVDLSVVSDWLPSVNMLPSLVQLNLAGCRLKNLPPSLPRVNFTTLEVLDLSVNDFKSSVPIWIFNTSQSLVSLSLRSCQLRGSIHREFGNMSSLTFLDLSNNHLKGEVPTFMGTVLDENQAKVSSKLRELNLSSNNLNGSLENFLPQLSNLLVLDVASNSFSGHISEAQLENLSNLLVLDLSSNIFSFNISSSWVPPFQLDTIGLGSCPLGPQFPGWLRSQKDFLSLDLSNASISDAVPNWFWALSDKVKYLNLFGNQLVGEVPDFSSKVDLETLDLSRNSFDGRLPCFSPNMVSLDLSSNKFSGSISSVCEMLVQHNTVRHLDLSGNMLSGLIPDCWMYGQSLFSLDMSHNNLSGTIPYSIGNLARLHILHLEHNSLSGKLPSSLKKCTSLVIFIVDSNRLSGTIPQWIEVGMQNLVWLSLRNNAFEGSIPGQLCQLKHLRVLDLSSNNFSGTIPRCINNFHLFSLPSESMYEPYFLDVERELFARYKKLYPSVLRIALLLLIDLSSNSLSGDIPEEISSLIGLSVLNLSGNHLTGSIPDIRNLQSLEALYLSRNELSCSIPPGLTELLFLSSLNLSHNKLSGEIPRGNQFSTFDGSSYVGNPNLCGPPLENTCIGNKIYEDPSCRNATTILCNEGNGGSNGDCEYEDDDRSVYDSSLYISVGLGFAAGLWCFVCPLVMSNSWRRAYYEYLGNLYDKVYVIIVVYVIRRRF